jgi:hypothetical protein
VRGCGRYREGMTYSSPEYLAGMTSDTPDGVRLRLAPLPARELAAVARFMLGVGAGVAAAVTVLVWLGSAVMADSLGWPAVLGVFAGVFLVIEAWILAFYRRVRTRRKSLELRPASDPAEVIVITGGGDRHREVIALTDLREVIVRETRRSGQRKGLIILLDLADGRRLRCLANAYVVQNINARELAGWLREHLGSSAAGVRHESLAARDFGHHGKWMPAYAVAYTWGVPASEVAAIARERDVTSRTYTMHSHVSHNPDGTHTVKVPSWRKTTTVTEYDRASVYDIALDLDAERAAQKTPDRNRRRHRSQTA